MTADKNVLRLVCISIFIFVPATSITASAAGQVSNVKPPTLPPPGEAVSSPQQNSRQFNFTELPLTDHPAADQAQSSFGIVDLKLDTAPAEQVEPATASMIDLPSSEFTTTDTNPPLSVEVPHQNNNRAFAVEAAATGPAKFLTIEIPQTRKSNKNLGQIKVNPQPPAPRQPPPVPPRKPSPFFPDD